MARRKNLKNKDSISSLWDNFKRSNIHILGVPEWEEKEHEIGNLFEKIMKQNFPNLVKEIDMQVQEAQSFPNKMDAKRPTPRHIIIKMPKVKDSYLQWSSHKTVSWYLKRNLQARRDWQEIFKVKSRDLQPKLLYPAKLSLELRGRLIASQTRKN